MDRSGLLLASAPFLRLLFPLCLGVSLPLQGPLSHPLPVLIFFLLALLILGLFRKISFYHQPVWGALLLLTIFYFGLIRTKQQTMIFPHLPKQQYFVALDDYPIEKEKTFQVVGQLINSEQKILIYLSKSLSVGEVKPGDILCFNGMPELIENDGNPYEFDYRRYLNNRKIGYRIFLKETQFHFLNGYTQLNIYRRALIFRAKLIENLDRSGIEHENVHLISSISFGARDEVDKETIQSFTNTGVIHVLAVSGMNVGLIFVILDFLFRFLKSGRAGYLLHTLIMLSGIWSYALITGMSASILRAAMMFSFVVMGTTLQRNSNIFNSLAVSAFLLITWDPTIIRDVGFQLSYAAVLSIVVIQPFIYKQLYFKTWLNDKTWLLLSVTFAAQIGTLPFTLHYFHQFPVYFWLANLMVIPLVTLILYLSFVVVFLFFVSGFLTSVFAWVLDGSVRLVLFSVNFVENLPHAVLKELYPSFFQLSLVFLMGYLVYRYCKIRKTILLQGVVLSSVVLSILVGCGSYQQLTRAEILFFNIPGTRALALTNRKEVIVLYDHSEKASEKLGYYMKPYLGKRGIRKVEMYQLTDSLQINNRDICVKGGLIFFKGVRLFVQPISETAKRRVAQTLCADLVWIRNIKADTNHFNIPESKIVLYRSKNVLGKDKKESYTQRWMNVKESVLLTARPSRSGSANRMFCSYFSQAD